jgi:hypothetical protein
MLCVRSVYSNQVFDFIIALLTASEFTDMKTSTKAFAHAANVLTVALVTASAMTASPAVAAPPSWVATWQASPQPVWGSDFLFPTNVPPTLHDQTVRQIARISLGGQSLRIVLSNTYGRQPLAIGKATIARPKQDGEIIPDTLRTVTFGDRVATSILPGASVISDPVVLSVSARAQVAVSIYLPKETPLSTFHWDGRQTSWIVPGDQSSAMTLTTADGSIFGTTAR